MKIGTFGSCLARGVAERYVSAFGGRIYSSVYHNRSDLFYRTFVTNELLEPSLRDLQIVCGINDTNDNEEFSEINILRNQVRSTMGQHLLSRGAPFIDAIESEELDLLVMDNFVDVAAATRVGTLNGSEFEFFSRVKPGPGNTLHLGAKLSAINAARYQSEIINYVNLRSPRTRVVFIIFPYNTYPEHSGRKEWTNSFSVHFRPRHADVFPCLEVPNQFHVADVPSHFTKDFMFVYAGMLRQTIYAHANMSNR